MGLIPKHVQDKLRNGYIAKAPFEQRPYFKVKTIWTKSDIARVRYTKIGGTWALFWRD